MDVHGPDRQGARRGARRGSRQEGCRGCWTHARPHDSEPPQGARGGAALAVRLYHVGSAAGGGTWLPGAVLAVDVFLLLSGFAVAWSHERRLRTGETTLRALAGVAVLAFALLWHQAHAVGSIDVGFDRRTLLGGAARFWLSFTLGVMIHRLGHRLLPRRPLPLVLGLPSFALVA